MPPQATIRYYSCVNEQCKLESNHTHKGLDIIAIPKEKNYVDFAYYNSVPIISVKTLKDDIIRS